MAKLKTTKTTDYVDFIDSRRMRNRNIRLGLHEEEALLRAAYSDDRTVSDEIRMTLTGKLPNLVERGYLCATCFQIDCKSHRDPELPAPKARKARKTKEQDPGKASELTA